LNSTVAPYSRPAGGPVSVYAGETSEMLVEVEQQAR